MKHLQQILWCVYILEAILKEIFGDTRESSLLITLIIYVPYTQLPGKNIPIVLVQRYEKEFSKEF